MLYALTVRSFDESERKRVADVVRKAYLEEKQSLAWTVGTIALGPLRGESLRTVLDEVESVREMDERKLQRLNQLVVELKNKALL